MCTHTSTLERILYELKFTPARLKIAHANGPTNTNSRSRIDLVQMGATFFVCTMHWNAY